VQYAAIRLIPMTIVSNSAASAAPGSATSTWDSTRHNVRHAKPTHSRTATEDNEKRPENAKFVVAFCNSVEIYPRRLLMKVCFPVIADAGMESTIYGHFASAPFFTIIDTETLQGSVIANCDPAHPYAGCNPFSALTGQHLDGIIVGGIGDDSLRVMNMCGFTVHQAISASVAENVALFTRGTLQEMAVMQSHLEGRCSTDESGCNCSH
jgi:predicted Fe-Mo cluster-binding NifX family protein